jgi:hypothetical protein
MMTDLKGTTARRRGLSAAGGLAILAGGGLLAGCGGPGSSASSGTHASAAQPSAVPSSAVPSSAVPSSAVPSGAAQSSGGAAGDALATRVCGGARQAAAKALGAPLAVQIVSPRAADLKCVLTGSQLQVAIESQAGPRAYTEFDTETSHQSQVFGNGGAHNPAQDPVQVTVRGSAVAVWIPAQLMIVATDSTPNNGGAGAYVTVTVSGRAATAKTALAVAEAAAGATFAARPDGPG